MKTLKRYANRRLYDSESSKTLTLEEVAEIIINGEEVRVIDNLSGEDITPKILGQTFLKVSVGQRNEDFANFMLTSLIREAGKNISSFFERLVLGGIGSNMLTKDRMEKILNSMVELGELKPENISSYREDILKHLATRANERKDEIQKELEKIDITVKDSEDELLGKLKVVKERLGEQQ